MKVQPILFLFVSSWLFPLLRRWAVDLDEPHLVYEVVVQTMDSSTSWIANFMVKVSDIKPPAPSGYNLDHRGYRLCGQFPGTPAVASSAVVECRGNNTIGQYVYIYIAAKNYLAFCEVEVFGIPHEKIELGPLDVNLAEDKDTWQASVYSGYQSSNANDGNFDVNLNQKSCAMMNYAIRNWWGVDLEKSYQFHYVVLTNVNSNRE